MVETAHVTYAGWEDCLRIGTDELEVVVTTTVGPRIVHCGLDDGENLLYLDPEQTGETGGEEWRLYGGHRLWHAPEVEGRTYQPDNDPVAVERHDEGVTLRQPTEAATGIRKELTVRLAPDAPEVTLTHRLTNEGVWPVELAPWAITVCQPGGTAVLPLSRGEEGLQADRSVTLWPYTSMADDRLSFTDEALLVTQDDGADQPTKVGASGADEWAAYVRDGTALRKSFAYDDAATYPDRNSPLQAYTDESMLELETLGPLRTVGPGESATHTEEWELVDGVEMDADDPVAAVENAR